MPPDTETERASFSFDSHHRVWEASYLNTTCGIWSYNLRLDAADVAKNTFAQSQALCKFQHLSSLSHAQRCHVTTVCQLINLSPHYFTDRARTARRRCASRQEAIASTLLALYFEASLPHSSLIITQSVCEKH